MNLSNNPWADIPIASKGRYSRLRVSDTTHMGIFWLRDDTDRLGLLIEISKDISSASLNQAKINIRDISVDIRDIIDEKIRVLIIRLENPQNRDVFLKLCLDLIERVETLDRNEDTFLAICKRLRKWQSLLSGKWIDFLSINERYGLFAELSFLAEMLERNISTKDALIRGWEGPNGTQQDFILDDAAIEVKSIAGNQRGKVRISSEYQLDTHLDRLYLRVYFLSEISDGEIGESLNALVLRIHRLLGESKSRDLFEAKLELAGYIDIPEYDKPLFRIADYRTYLASDDFPRIIGSDLPKGVEAVAYNLVLASIEDFRIDTMDLLRSRD